MSGATYLIYVLISSATIASPGPGIILTFTNSLKYGLIKSFSGIIGIAAGMFLISILVGSGIVVVILDSEITYNILKFLGTIYLLYFGIKLIKNRNNEISFDKTGDFDNQCKLFVHGLGITIINPKPIIFFAALFPQFISNSSSYFDQFILLSITFCILIIFIHVFYGFIASYIKKKASGMNYFKLVNIFGGVSYIVFSLSLAITDINSLT